MRAPAGLAGSVLFSATGSARLINRGGATAAPAPTAPPTPPTPSASVRLSAAGCCRIAAAAKEGEKGLVGWLLAAEETDERALAVAVAVTVVVVGPAKPCCKESANRAKTRRGSETRKRKHIIIFLQMAAFSSPRKRSLGFSAGGQGFFSLGRRGVLDEMNELFAVLKSVCGKTLLIELKEISFFARGGGRRRKKKEM